MAAKPDCKSERVQPTSPAIQSYRRVVDAESGLLATLYGELYWQASKQLSGSSRVGR